MGEYGRGRSCIKWLKTKANLWLYANNPGRFHSEVRPPGRQSKPQDVDGPHTANAAPRLMGQAHCFARSTCSP